MKGLPVYNAGMADALEQLPLLPLNTVIFPYAQTQLHVFEPRHQEMVRYCTENDTGFGVVLTREGSDTYLVGTAVRIAATRTLDDGNIDLRVHGQRRFRVRRLDEREAARAPLAPAIEQVRPALHRVGLLAFQRGHRSRLHHVH